MTAITSHIYDKILVFKNAQNVILKEFICDK